MPGPLKSMHGGSKSVFKQTTPLGKSFSCPNCGAPLKITDFYRITTVACGSCQSIIDTTNENLAILQAASNLRSVQPYIPLGEKGKLFGTVWKCIGFLQKSDPSEQYFWKEYLLYNPYKGYRWLFEYDGHWTFFKRVRTIPEEISFDKYSYLDKKYKLYNKGEAVVQYVEGEFYWRVKRGDASETTDYINPPFYLSSEQNEREKIWTYGKYLPGTKVQKAYKIKEDPPIEMGVAPNEIWPKKEKFKEVKKTFVLCALFIFAGWILSNARQPNLKVYNESKSVSVNKASGRFYGSAQDEVHITEEFDIPGKTNNIQVRLESPVYNSWRYFDILLVNKNTGKGIPIGGEVSYYRGSDWSEGSQKKRILVENVPPGTYHLSIKYISPIRTKWRYYLEVSRGVPIHKNLFWALALLAIYPIMLMFNRYKFNVRRWSNSDFSPYHGD